MGQAKRKKDLGIKNKKHRFVELARFICDKTKYSELDMHRAADCCIKNNKLVKWINVGRTKL